MARGISFPLIVALLISGCATTKGGGSSGGRVLSPNVDPVLNSAMTGAAIGAIGGPIGLGIGAFLGYLHGLLRQKKMEEHAETEMTQQAQIDKALEEQLEAKRKAAQNGMAGNTGLILVKDHLAPEPATASTSPPPPSAPGGEGLVMVTDNLASSSPSTGSTVTKTEGLSGAMAKAGQTHNTAEREVRAANAALEKQIIAARERQRKLVEALQGTTASTPKPNGATSPQVKTTPPATDPEGFRLVHAGGQLARKERDVDGDGKPDILRYYDETGELIRQEEDSRLDGRPDTWTFFEAGRLVRKESDTNGNGKVDLWAFYDGADTLVRTEADTDHNQHRDRVILYEQGEIVEEQRYSPGLDPPQLIVAYANGQPKRKDEDTDGDGRMDRVTEYDAAGHVTKVSRNPAGAGTFALVATYQPKTGEVLHEEEDLNGDGSIDVISHYEKGRLVRREFFDLPEIASLSPHLSVPPGPSKQETP
ncbi:MAG: FG-GAP repeat domain-containing protein [Candidatus Methylomirabilales bacterium]